MAIVVIMVAFAHPPWTTIRLIGLALAIPAFTVLTISRIQLGNAFSVTPQATMLVTHGIYSRIRHPVYVFSAIALVGFFLYLNLPQLLLLLIIIIPAQILRAKAEERLLEEHFGEEYRAYKRATWL